MKKILLLIATTCILFSCNEKVASTIFDKMDVTSIISLAGDSTTIFTTDYFPQIENFDSLVSNDVEIIEIESGKVFQIIAKSSDYNEWIGSIDFYKDNNKGSVILRKEEVLNTTLTYNAKAKSVCLRGQMNNWNANASPFVSQDGENWSLSLNLPAGEYQYLLVIDGKDRLDPNSSVSVSNGMGGFNSLLALKGVDKNLAPFLVSEKLDNNKVILSQIVDNQSDINIIAFWQNTRLPDNFIDFDGIKLSVIIPANAKNFERSYLRVYAYNADGGYSNDVFIPLKYGKVIENPDALNRHDKQNMIIYSLMIDRFYNGDKNNDQKLNSPDVNPKVDYFGGDLQGVDFQINADYFNRLGVNTIWLSPIIQNPFDAWGFIPNPPTKFSGYHGYWPVILKQVDTRFGNDEVLKTLISDAHTHNLNILLDWVANHAHQNSYVYQQHPDWHTPDTTPDGRPNFELWDEFRLTTWFDRHIPTLDLEREEVREALTDSALYWLKTFDIDGFRHDATKHIPEVYWRLLVHKMKTLYPNRSLYQIGETYGSPALINLYVKSGMLDAQFDFNLFDAVCSALINDNQSFDNVAKVLKSSLTAYGYHHLMGNIIDNHDKPRFISLAGGQVRPNEDTKLAGWTREIGVGDDVAYKKLKLLQAFVMTVPGIPCIYQGDEIGQPGANDPDNRRWMQFDNLSEKETEVLNNVKKLSQIRKENLALIYGDYIPIVANENVFAFARVYMGKCVVVALNKSKENQSIKFTNPLNKQEEELNIEAMGYVVISDM